MLGFNVQVTAYGRQTVPDRGVVRSCDPLKILEAQIISLERLNLKSSNFVHEYSLSRLHQFKQQDGISPTKERGCGHVTVLKFCRLP